MKALITSFFVILTFHSAICQTVLPQGGGLDMPGQNCLPQAEKEGIIERIKNGPYYKEEDDKLTSRGFEEPFLSSPIKFTPKPENATDSEFYGISNFVDNHLIFPDQIRDYTCGVRTYDTQWGYNHSGVDYFPYPFLWHKMLNEEMTIVAAAEGIVVDIVDGQADMNCSLSGNPPEANKVTVQHPNGFYSLYLHLKKNSIVPAIGDFVAAGDKLGIVGSSGNSTGPHLHFEIWDPEFKYIEPFYDEDHPECHVHIENSLWLEQEPYKNPQIYKVMTASSVQNPADCIEEIDDEGYFAQNNFSFGDSVLCYLYLRDLDEGDNVQVKIYDPRGATFFESTINCNTVPSSCQFWNSSYWYFTFIFSENNHCGEYTMDVRFHDDIVTHKFMVEEVPTPGPIAGNHNPLPGAEESYSVVTPQGTTFGWYALGGEVISGAQESEVLVRWNDNVSTANICLVIENEAGCGSDPYCEQVLIGTSSTEEATASQLVVHPNPFSDQLILRNYSAEKIEQFSLIDNSGREMQRFGSIENLETTLNLAELTAGIYFLKINVGTVVVLKKVVKM